MTFNEEEDEDTLVEEGPQIQSGTVFLRGTCDRTIYQRSIRDKRIPREAFFDLGDVKVENVIVTFNEKEYEDILVEEGLQIERDTLCFTRTHANVRFTRETFVTSGSRLKRVLTLAMSKWRITL